MNKDKFLELRYKRGSLMGKDGSVHKTYQETLDECRKYLENSSGSIKSNILDFIETVSKVEGFLSEDGNFMDTKKLTDSLIEDITNYGIMSAAMADTDVNEIRSNGNSIVVEKGGRCLPYLDDKGKRIFFESVEEQDIILRKLMGTTRLTPTASLVSTSTVEGYRIAAVHSSATSADPLYPNRDRYHSFVLRKLKQSKMELSDIVKYGTMSDNMARLLSISAVGGLSFITVGPTASGKSTTNNAALLGIPEDIRVVLIQNPSEIDLRKRDDYGRVVNDVLHLEAHDVANPKAEDATMANLMTHTLRLSPTFIGIGEVRTNREFKEITMIGQAGHPFNCTFHSGTPKEAVKRYLSAYLSESGNEPAEIALSTITSLVGVIIVQKILRDGTRRVMYMTEVLGAENGEPILNDIYKYVISKSIYDADGRVSDVIGEHKRVGKISKDLIDRLAGESINPCAIEFCTKDVDPDEIEEYTGDVKVRWS